MCFTTHTHAEAAGSSLLERLEGRRLVVITGKGGTGKSTVTAALGLAAARSGKRTLLIETGGAHGLASLLGRDRARYRVIPVGERLHLLSMTPHEALEDFVVRQLKLRSLYRLVFRNRIVGPFIDAVPGLPDIIQLGKIWDLAQERTDQGPHWDMLILDAPATGHGLTMLASPASMADVTRSGPLHANAQRVRALIADPSQTAIVLTTLAEPLPVNEALQLHQGLGPSRRQVVGCVINQVQRSPFEPLDAWTTAAPALPQPDSPDWNEAVALAHHWVTTVRRQRASSERLRQGLGLPTLDLPYRLQRQPELRDLEALADSFTNDPMVAP